MNSKVCSCCGADVPEGTGVSVIKGDNDVKYRLCSIDCYNLQVLNFKSGDCFKVTGLCDLNSDEFEKINDVGAIMGKGKLECKYDQSDEIARLRELCREAADWIRDEAFAADITGGSEMEKKIRDELSCLEN